MKSKLYKGSCLCGRVRFKAATPESKIYFCHCIMCRKNYGLYGAFIAVPQDDFHVSNDKGIIWYKSSKDVQRGFCKTCGSPIAWKKKKSTHIFFLPGLVDGKVGKKTPMHIFTESKGDYYRIDKKSTTSK